MAVTTRIRSAQALLVAGIVLLAAGAAAAAADEPAVSPPEVFRASSGADNLSSNGFDGEGVTVAVIDTGVADVPALGGVVVHQANLSSAPDAGDQYGHGTFVAGIVHSIAPEAKLVSIKLSDANGAVDVSQVLAALQWVIAHRDVYGIDVVNLSFGNDSTQSAYSSPLNFAVQQVWDAGLVVVASSGNLGDQPGTVTKPGDDPLIISVGSSDERGTPTRSDDTVPGFVSRGPTQDGLDKPDLVAPGTRLVSLRAPGSTVDQANPQARVGEWGFRGSGTSFSAPLVTGVVAQMLSADPTLTPDQVKYGLLDGATTIDGDPTAMGAGTVRAGRALNRAYDGVANEGVQRSTGCGSLQSSRGSAVVKVEAEVELASGIDVEVAVPVVGERIAAVETVDALIPDLGEGDVASDALDTFDCARFVEEFASWDASHWGASHWGASHWGASHWGASHWGASHWGSSQWWASHWG